MDQKAPPEILGAVRARGEYMHYPELHRSPMVLFLLFLLFVSLGQVLADNGCGGGFTVAGSPSANRLTRVWMDGYTKKCPGVQVQVDDSSASTGAARVCGVRRGETEVDVASMTRHMNKLEATTENGFVFQCERSTRGTVQVDIGIEGAAIATSIDGVGAHCVKRLGGLTVAQLRWMFSSMTESQLMSEEDGWEGADAVPNSDRNDATRLWSELHRDCAQEEINITGLPLGTPVHQFFADEIFKAQGESIDQARYTSEANMRDLVNGLNQSGNAVGFFNIRYVLSEKDKHVIESVKTVNIMNQRSGIYIDPSAARYRESEYVLIGFLHFNVNNQEETLAKVRPFLEYGFSQQGTENLLGASFLPLHGWEQAVMKTRVQSATGIPTSMVKDHCGPAGSEISIAGSSTVFPVAQIWAAVYEVGCNVKIALEGGGSSSGAERVCGNLERGSPVDIGDMSRGWKASEADESIGFLYSCLVGDRDRSAIQIPVAVDGLTVASSVGGAARECIELLGGLSTDQLRWIYSDYSDSKLLSTGWDPASLQNSDNDSMTHSWNELDARCENVEIRISGPDDESGTYEYFKESILSDYASGESTDEKRVFGYFSSANDEELVQYIQEFGGAISYFGYSYYFQNKDSVFPVPIKNDKGVYVTPNDGTIRDSSYNPLARTIFMNLLNDGDRLESTVPFVKFGLMAEQLVPVTGYVSISSETRAEAVQRLDEGPYRLGDDASSSQRKEISKSLLGGIVALVLVLLGVVACGVSHWFLRSSHDKEEVLPSHPKLVFQLREEICT